MSCHTASAESLRSSGVRLTPQRMMILEAVHHLPGHATAEEILAYVQARHPYVDLSTVYRTLDLLVLRGVVVPFEAGGAATAFEVATQPHHHLVCRRCGAVAETGTRPLRQLARRLAAEHGFRAELDHLAIRGLCATCTAEAPPAPD